eukprot:TRINITY_DN2582_c5_g1_i1.p2 TRINITY_DN2582_c5_g1~~TRINITY_DN2582_c5_g1_i1.p2  ORF type:complete len:108 (+),score=2.54 TRINITY_DN2582_c5_g1_i1:248-571(+)
MQRVVHFKAVPAVDREPRGSRTRYRLRSEVFRPCRPHVLHFGRHRKPATRSFSVASVRGLRPYGQPGQRGGGAAVDGELARVPEGGGDGAARRGYPAGGGDSGDGVR